MSSAWLSGRAGGVPTRGGEYLAGRMLLVILACTAALLVAGCSGSEISASETSASETSQEEGAGPATDRPNIIFVLTDDLDYASTFKMPEIRSRLIEEGISLEDAFVSHPICCPSRATLLTGLYDHNHGVKGNAPPEGGFQTFVSEGREEEVFFTDVLSGQSTDFVSRAAPEDQPFFAYVAPTAPHGPATAAERHKGAFADEKASRPPSFDEEDVSDKPSPIKDAERITEEEASNIDDYYRQRLKSMMAVDEMVGALLEELKAAGELDNTYIFFTSDNGWFQGEHRIQSTKNRPYEESARVPLFIRGPAIPAGTNTDKLTLNTDLAPTFAELAGASFAADGRSLAPLLRGEEPASWRSSVLLEKLPQKGNGEEGNGKGKAKGKAKNKAKGKEGETGPGSVPKSGPGQSSDFQAVRTETHKYVEYDNGDVELYDLQSDPYELENLHKSVDPALLEELKARLEALRDCSEEGCREAENAP